MQDGLVQAFAGRQMLQAANVAADQNIRLGGRDIAQFAVAELGGKLRLQDGISAPNRSTNGIPKKA